MKQILAVVVLFMIGSMSFGQVITYDDFRSVIPLLQKEDFKGAFERTDQLLQATQNDSSDLRGIVTYMNIYSAAGMVSLDQMTHAGFQKNAGKYIGQRIVMSAHPCIDSAAKGCGGTLTSVEVNPNNSKIWIARLHISNAFARDMTAR